MLLGCDGVSQLLLTHSEGEMVEGQWEQRQKTLTHVSSGMLTACVLWDKTGWGLLFLINSVQQLVQFGSLIACGPGALEVCVCLHAA